jgi:hypothetical protein
MKLIRGKRMEEAQRLTQEEVVSNNTDGIAPVEAEPETGSWIDLEELFMNDWEIGGPAVMTTEAIRAMIAGE